MANQSTPSYKAILKKYNLCSDQVKNYFEHLPTLISDYPYEIAIAYLFQKTEKAQNDVIYCGVVKLHRANSTLAKQIVNKQHISRQGFLDLFKNVFGSDLPQATANKIKDAEKARDKILHGKVVNDREMREAISDVLEYAEAVNKHLESVGGFKPFSKLSGFKGAAKALDHTTTRWLLKGMGFVTS